MSDIRTFYSNIGVVESISDGIINILGLQNAANGEMVEIFINSNIKSNKKKFNNNLLYINKKFYHKSNINTCYWRIGSNFFYNKDIKSIKLNKIVNESIKEYNKSLINSFFYTNKINKFEHEGLLANNNKIALTLKHPLLYWKQDNKFICLTETSYKEALIRRPLERDKILTCNIAVYHKADKLIIKEYNNKFYVLAFWKLGNEDISKMEELVDYTRIISFEERKDFETFINSNIEEFYKNEIDVSSFYNIKLLLESIVDSNQESIINLSNIDKNKGEL